jgi:hypothetical protein
MGAIFEIPQFAGKLIIPPSLSEFHIGKQDIRDAITIMPKDEHSFDPISSVRKDAQGTVLKEQFIIRYTKGSYTIEDRGSTNGTYLGSKVLKGQPPTALSDGMEIIIPIQDNNQLMQLKMIFRIVPDSALGLSGQATYNDPANISGGQPQYHAPQYSSPTSNSASPQYHQPIYSGPPQKAKAGITTPTGQQAVPIPSGQAEYYDPQASSSMTGMESQSQMMLDSNSSFIVHSQMGGGTIPPNAFSPNSGIDLDFVWKLEKSENWHILMALLLLVTMIFRTTLNIAVFMLILKYVTIAEIGMEFLQFIPIILIFPLSFLIHELAHLNMGKHFKYQSRFCLTKVGLRTTLIAIIIGIPFGLPGAAVSVGVDPAKDQRQMGFIKTAGPASNFILGVIFLIISVLIPITSELLFRVKMGVIQGASLNLVLGLFNMVPVAIRGFALDGQYIIKWKPALYVGLVIALIICFIVVFVLMPQFQMAYSAWYYETYYNSV